jgi:hypothetical protein
MSRPVFVIPFLAFALQVSQAQLSSHGAPASATSPTADGRQHGVPATVLSPTPLPPGVHAPLRSGVNIHGPMRRFGSQHQHRPQTFVPVPLFYPIYSDGAYPSPADPYVSDPSTSADPAQTNSAQTAQGSANPSSTNPSSSSQSSGSQGDDELRAAYLQGAHDALTRREQGDSRYGDHYMDSRERDSRERSRQEAGAQQKSQASSTEFSMIPVEDKTPATVFIFKDGHQLETKNYAIMGGTLFDFSGKMLKKVQLDDLDSAATAKANDDRGVVVKLQ